MKRYSILFLSSNQIIDDQTEWDVAAKILKLVENNSIFDIPAYKQQVIKDVLRHISFGEQDINFVNLERRYFHKDKDGEIVEWPEDIPVLYQKTFRIYDEENRIVSPSILKDWLNSFRPDIYEEHIRRKKHDTKYIEIPQYKGDRKSKSWKDHR